MAQKAVLDNKALENIDLSKYLLQFTNLQENNINDISSLISNNGTPYAITTGEGYGYLGIQWPKNASGNQFRAQLRMSGWGGGLQYRTGNGWTKEWESYRDILDSKNYMNYISPNRLINKTSTFTLGTSNLSDKGYKYLVYDNNFCDFCCFVQANTTGFRDTVNAFMGDFPTPIDLNAHYMIFGWEENALSAKPLIIRWDNANKSWIIRGGTNGVHYMCHVTYAHI